MSNPYAQPLGSTHDDNARWECYRAQWERNHATGHTVRDGLRVVLAVEAAWWRKERQGLRYIPIGATGTIRRFSLHWGDMWGITWDAHPHPRASQGDFCGMSEREGDVLPGYLAQPDDAA